LDVAGGGAVCACTEEQTARQIVIVKNFMLLLIADS
jgi:hypothetical protein